MNPTSETSNGADPRDGELLASFHAYFRRHNLRTDNGTDRATVGRRLSYADGTAVYRYLNIEKWAGGTLEKFEKRLAAFLNNELRLLGGGDLVNDSKSFVIPSVFAFLNHARRGRMISVGHGEAGAGKTCACLLYAAQHRSNTVYHHVWEWTSGKGALTAELVKLLEIEPRAKESPAQALARHLRDRDMMLVLDNAHELKFSSRKFLADLADFSGVPIALIGNVEIIAQWARVPQHKRRALLKRDVTLDLYDDNAKKNTAEATLGHLMERHLPDLADNAAVRREMMKILQTKRSGACGSVVAHAHHTRLMLAGGITDPLKAFQSAQTQLLEAA
jgi:DNA transposition AAA+ family ATPase